MRVLAGNLFVQCEIEAHQFFTREENDVHVTVPISIATAVLGGLVKVPTIDGEQEVAIPPGYLVQKYEC
jgi:molecular chaperone DnaJ